MSITNHSPVPGSAIVIRHAPGIGSAFKANKRNRIASIDLVRGVVMIIMALDHVRDYFHRDAFLYSPTDLTHTNTTLFFTRFITHYCAPVFVFLSGISAYLYGAKRSNIELSFFLFTRGIWLVLAEVFIISLLWTFNPSYPIFNLQVIWATGISMIVLSALIYMPRLFIMMVAIVLIGGHNLLDNVRATGNGTADFLWSILHEPKDFMIGHLAVFVRYPVIPWIGIIALGYCFGSIYNPSIHSAKRRKILVGSGVAAILFFILLRSFNIYGDAATWEVQKNTVFSLLSILNVTKYPPSLLYILITLGPAMILLAVAEKPLNSLTQKISVFGRVPFFYYVLHIFLIHLLAVMAAVIQGHLWSVMILTDRVNRVPELKGYGFSLWTVYMVWIALLFILYPFCRWFDDYKRKHQTRLPWLSYL